MKRQSMVDIGKKRTRVVQPFRLKARKALNERKRARKFSAEDLEKDKKRTTKENMVEVATMGKYAISLYGSAAQAEEKQCQQHEFGTSSCGLAGLVSVLVALGENKEDLKKRIRARGKLPVHMRACGCTEYYQVPHCPVSIPEYCKSRAEAGTNAKENVQFAAELMDGGVVAFIDTFYPRAPCDAGEMGRYCAEWMRQGAAGIASLNLAREGEGDPVWHAQMIWAVSNDYRRVFLTNGADSMEVDNFHYILTSPGEMKIKARVVLHHKENGGIPRTDDWQEKYNCCGPLWKATAEEVESVGKKDTIERNDRITLPRPFPGHIRWFAKRGTEAANRILAFEEKQ